MLQYANASHHGCTIWQSQLTSCHRSLHVAVCSQRTDRLHTPFNNQLRAPNVCTRYVRTSSRKLLCVRAAVTLSTAEETDTVSPQPKQAHFVLDVQGMKCGGCSGAVKRILQQQDYVLSAGVNLVTNTAALGVADGTSARQLADRAAELLTSKGFPATVRAAEAELSDLSSSRSRDSGDESLLALGFAWTLVAFCCLHHAGHALHDMGFHSIAHLPALHALGNPWVSGVLGGAALLGPGRPLIKDGVLALWRGAPNMNSLIGLGTATSFAIGLASAMIPGLSWDPSFLEEPVMLLAFVLLGRTLEARARAKAAADLQGLASLIPAEARLVLDPNMGVGTPDPAADIISVPSNSIRAGDVVRILPGERFPVDGQIIDGKCGADESMLTGESIPVPKDAGSMVCAGTVCYEGAVTVKASSTGRASRLAGIAKLVEEAQAREAPVQRLADNVAGKFCYTVMGASATTLTFWALLGGALFPDAVEAVSTLEAAAPAVGGAALLLAIKLAVDVLVVACPCALGLATPTAVVVASSAAARRGLLLRGGDVLEGLAGVDTVVLDKTGTLTKGQLQLQEITSFGCCTDEQVLHLAAAVEGSTRHPVASALMAAAQARPLSAAAAAPSLAQPSSTAVPESPLASVLQGLQRGATAVECSTVPGEGVWGVVEGVKVAVGRQAWVAQQVRAGHQHSAAQESGDRHASSSGRTQVFVGLQGHGLVGCCSLADELRPEARAVVQALRARGCEVVVLSGDNSATARSMAAAAGIKDARGDMKPEDKVAAVRALQQQGRHVAMVGDGVNDAPALAGANVGVALSSGLDAAASAADVVLVGSNLKQLVQALDVGRTSLAKIRQNLSWALVYNLVGIPVAAGALLPGYGISLSPSVAAGLMACSSIAVVSNSLLLRPAIERITQNSHFDDGAGSAATTPSGHLTPAKTLLR